MKTGIDVSPFPYATRRHHPSNLMQNETHSLLILHGPLRGDVPHQQHCFKGGVKKILYELGT